jgi:hypothetical protein
MNYIYEKLREENKLFEIKDDVIVSKLLSKENAIGNQNVNILNKFSEKHQKL